MITSNVNFNLYKSFIAVYDHKNISKAAASLQITQPTVTYNVKELERQLGVKLFHTHPRGVESTKDAHELYKFVSSGIMSIVNGESAIKEFTEDTTAVLRLAVTSGPSSSYIAKAISAFSAKFPKVTFIILDAKAEDGITKLAQYSIDLVVAFCTTENPNLVTIDLKEFPRTAIVGPTFAKKNKLVGKVSKKQLEELPLVISSSCKCPGDDMNAEFLVSDYDMMKILVKENLGVGICSCSINDDTEIVSLDTDYAPQTLKLVYNKDSITKPARAFAEELCGIFNVDAKLS